MDKTIINTTLNRCSTICRCFVRNRREISNHRIIETTIQDIFDYSLVFTDGIYHIFLLTQIFHVRISIRPFDKIGERKEMSHNSIY